MQKTIQYIKNELAGIYPESEIQGLIRIIIEWITGWDYTQQNINKETQLKETERQKIVSVINRLKKNEPIQYILEETEFLGLNIKVTPDVLIPRSETEELVLWILKKNKNLNSKILDIGTGSGCIALALKEKLQKAKIWGVDISDAALEIAKENSLLNHLDVEYIKADILRWQKFNWGTYDIIVSNPPYVRESEKMQMHENVILYEPAVALFVSDVDPLIFYRNIAAFAMEKLNDNGLIFFEINESFGSEMFELLHDFGYKNIELNQDINGKKRMICGSKKL